MSASDASRRRGVHASTPFDPLALRREWGTEGPIYIYFFFYFFYIPLFKVYIGSSFPHSLLSTSQ